MSNRLTTKARLTVLTGLLAASALALSACAQTAPEGSDQDPTETVTTVWSTDGADMAPFGELVEAFNETTQLGRLELVNVPGASFADKIRPAMATDQRPGMFFNHGAGAIRDYAQADLLIDLQGAFDADPDLKDAFIPSMLEIANIDGKYYGIPNGSTQPVVFFYNKKLFSDAGIEFPETWDDLLDAVAVFKEQGVIPISLAGGSSWTLLMYWEYLLDRVGGPDILQRIQDGDWSAWGDPAMLEATEMITELVEAGAFGDNYASISYGQGGSETLLADGQAAMYLMGSWAYTSFLTNNPDFATSDLGYAAFPLVPGGKGDPSNVVGNPTTYTSVTISANAETSFAFLSTLASDEYIDAVIATGGVPVTKTAGERLSKAPNPEFSTWLFEAVAGADSFTQSWDQALGQEAFGPVLPEMQNLVLGVTTPQQFIDNVLALG